MKKSTLGVYVCVFDVDLATTSNFIDCCSTRMWCALWQKLQALKHAMQSDFQFIENYHLYQIIAIQILTMVNCIDVTRSKHYLWHNQTQTDQLPHFVSVKLTNRFGWKFQFKTNSLFCNRYLDLSFEQFSKWHTSLYSIHWILAQFFFFSWIKMCMNSLLTCVLFKQKWILSLYLTFFMRTTVFAAVVGTSIYKPISFRAKSTWIYTLLLRNNIAECKKYRFAAHSAERQFSLS